MPQLHRYFGSPIDDLDPQPHLRHALQRHPLRHAGDDARRAAAHGAASRRRWEYASEMILKARELRLRTGRGAGPLLQGPRGRESHLKRAGWTAPWQAGWINAAGDVPLRARLLPSWWPGSSCCCSACVLARARSRADRRRDVWLDLHWMLLGLVDRHARLQRRCSSPCSLASTTTSTASSRERALRLLSLQPRRMVLAPR